MEDFLSTAEVAKVLKVSRVAILKKITKKQIEAKKIGRNYIIPKKEVLKALGLALGDENKKEIDQAIKRALGEYGAVFKKLGKE
jgi:excisionase family DNA binding protein